MKAHKPRRFQLVNVAIGLTAAAIAGCVAASHVNPPMDVRGMLSQSLSHFLLLNLAVLLPLAALVAWGVVAAAAIFRIGHDYEWF